MSWRYNRNQAPSPRSRARLSVRKAVNAIGMTLVAFGVILLLFVAYLLWGTGLYTSQHQNALHAQFCRENRSAKACNGSGSSRSKGTTGSHATTTVPSTTTTTLPISGVKQPVPGDVPPEGQPVGIIQIPKIGLDMVVVEGTSTADLRLGPGHYPGTPLPGQPGNAAIAGHRTTYLHPFYNLNEMAPGDPIYITTAQGLFKYATTQLMVVDPSDVEVVAPTPTPELTLTTCNPRFSASQRLVLQASLVSPPAPAPPHASREKPPSISSGLAGEQGSWTGTVGWGAACVAVAAGVLMFGRRRRRRWVTYLVGLVPFLVLLFFFFENLSPLLPASY